MSRITILETPQVTLWYHPEEKIVHHCIRKFIYGETFYHLLLTGTELIRQHHAEKWLSNIQNDILLRPEDLQWGLVNWLPQTAAAGWKYWAIVQPESVHVQLDLEPLVKEYSNAGIKACFFIDEKTAWGWLVELP